MASKGSVFLVFLLPQSLGFAIFFKMQPFFSLTFRLSLCAKLSERDKKSHLIEGGFGWAQKDSNLRPSACKADALNQLSYAPF
jgi:hypothetical protein